MLMRTVLKPLVSGSLLSIAPQHALPAPLDDAGLKREIIGRVLSASMGFMPSRVLHREDGTSVMRGSMGSDDGRWQKSNNGKYCSSMRGIVLSA